MSGPSSAGASRGRIWVARLLAVLALAGVVVLVIVIVNSTLGGEDDQPGKRGGAGKERSDNGGSGKGGGSGSAPETYTVETGDSLSTIADRFGVSIEQLEKLNPEADPQALVAGQELTVSK